MLLLLLLLVYKHCYAVLCSHVARRHAAAGLAQHLAQAECASQSAFLSKPVQGRLARWLLALTLSAGQDRGFQVKSMLSLVSGLHQC